MKNPHPYKRKTLKQKGREILARQDDSHSELAPHLGKLVNYYLDGYRVGYLDELKSSVAMIRPIAAYKANIPNRITVPTKHIWPIL